MKQEPNVQPNDRVAFDCEECGKNLQLTGTKYIEYYEGHKTCIACRKEADES